MMDNPPHVSDIFSKSKFKDSQMYYLEMPKLQRYFARSLCQMSLKEKNK